MSNIEESECSTSSEVSHGTSTPFSSPFQQVPGNTLPQYLSNLDDASMHSDGDKPYLKILNQPQEQFRFRYPTESGTHGYLQGKNKFADMARTFPTVELRNYSGKAVIKCQLYEVDKEVEHLHKLHEHVNSEVSTATVPYDGGYVVCFRSLGVIYTAKKDVPGLLYTRKENSMSKAEFKKLNKKNLRDECSKEAKAINLHKVRLRFSAHDVDTDEPICAPVYSDPINDKKSPDTNELKICISSHYSGGPSGGFYVILLVEKIKKGGIQVNVFNKDRSWVSHVPLTDANVHHQFGIVFRMPQYQRVDITESVDVFIELHNTSDKRTSNAIPFTYIPDKVYTAMSRAKKRKLDSSSQSPTCSVSSPASSIPSVSDISTYNYNNLQIPTSRTPNTIGSDADSGYSGFISTPQDSNSYSQTNPQHVETSTDIDFETAFNEQVPGSTVEEYQVIPTTGALESSNLETLNLINSCLNDPLLSESSDHVVRNTFTYSHPSNVSYDESDLQRFENFIQSDDNFEEYLREMDPLKVDSGRPSVVKDCMKTVKKIKEEDVYFKPEDGLEVKKLMKEICQLKKNKCETSVDKIKEKLERMFEIRMTNGDTFLHMTLTSHLQTFKFIVDTIDSVALNYLLDEVNDQQQTLLHLAVMHDMPTTVAYLIEKGCDPMRADSNGNTVVHYAVISKTILGPLLEAMDKTECKYDLDKLNSKWQSPLMVAVVNGWETEARMLAERGATIVYQNLLSNQQSSSADIQSSFVPPGSSFPPPKSSCTVPSSPLHIAASGHRPAMLQLLVNYVDKENIDVIDWKGMSALQIACAQPDTEDTTQIVKILLDKGADPMRHEKGTKPAWRLARGRGRLWDTITPYVTGDGELADTSEDDDTDDEYLSAESDSEDTDDLTKNIESLTLEGDTTISVVN